MQFFHQDGLFPKRNGSPERLYQSETLAELDFSEYVAMPARDLFHVYCVDSVRVDLKLEAEPISLSIEQTIPCGLILNELLSNSLKHAFPLPRTGTILVSYKRAGDRLELSVSDDGVGLPEPFEARQTRSLGFQVVCALTSQLCGELAITSQSGSRISVSWPAPEEAGLTAGSATDKSEGRQNGKP
jgi:two-component sensor histidine kinase